MRGHPRGYRGHLSVDGDLPVERQKPCLTFDQERLIHLDFAYDDRHVFLREHGFFTNRVTLSFTSK
jgi:hypothetical protein